ncbi:MAG: hypothetical protein K9G67_02115 [Bacteroidales bacterium]|nr:hypothetical protein [Bacteroidales bacterium]MCF8345256.1 hypothetical protein [Bacteroidales bacterium]MCF8349567.1 hypothetical protein [Bacteroidales bacterium]MCF8375126.1 hypothetical protein [Bacteroidales bacterium]MCF8400033.1 hypothetical protein [Bacteroidales bacterium]
MENNELQNTWNQLDKSFVSKSEVELDHLLNKKISKIILKYVYEFMISLVLCGGVLIFLIYSVINRSGDVLFIYNNLLLAFIISTLGGSLLATWLKFRNISYKKSLKTRLGEQIKILAFWLKGKYSNVYLFLIPVFYTMLLLSIHVYFEQATFAEIFNNEESLTGLIISLPIGLFVSYYVAHKIRKYQLNNLEHLEYLYNKIQMP